MNHAPVSRKHLRGLYPFVFCEICWDVDVFIVVLAGAGHEKFGDGQHHVRLNVPAFLEYRSRWQIFRLAFSGACPHPSVNSRDLRIAQARIVNEFAHLRISMPGRHLALHYIIANGPRPGSRVFIGHQRHGRDVVWAMADNTVRVQDRSHITVVGNFLPRTRTLLAC